MKKTLVMPLKLVVEVEMKEDFGEGNFFVEVKKKEKNCKGKFI